MDRDIPAFNQLVINKINQKNLYLHEQRLQNIRSAQNSRAYLSTSMNGRQNRKAQQLEEDKKTEIERHNLMLFNKMKRIMNRPDPHNRPLQQNAKNGTRTSMELTKIQEENRTMYERIERQRPTISNKKLYEERQKHLNVLKFLGKYSAHSIQNSAAQNIRASQTSSRTQNTFAGDRKKAYTVKPEHYLEDTETDANTHLQNKPRYDNIEFEDEIVEEDFNRMRAIIEAKRERRAVDLQEKRRQEEGRNNHSHEILQRQVKQKRLTQQRPPIPRSAKDITLYRTTQEISNALYQIRILRKHLTYEIRCSPQDSVEQPLKLQFSEDEGNRLLEQSNYNYASIIGQLRIANGRVTLSDAQIDPVPAINQRGRQDADLMLQIKNKRKNQFPFINSSHISEQNEEDSYQVEAKQKRSLARNDEIDELDSLGEEEQFEKYTTEQLSESQNNLDFMQRPANFQQKLQQLKLNNRHSQEQQLDPPAKCEIQLRNESEGPGREQQPHGNYEEALDEVID